MSQSIYSERGENNHSPRLGINDKKTIARNKAAFFKPKMILSKDNDYEIAYKKSDLEGNFDKLRIIFYVNNKTPFDRQVKINYDYLEEYYDVSVKEKMTEVRSHKEAREVLEIKLKSTYDLN